MTAMECDFTDSDGCLHFYFTAGEGRPIHAEIERSKQKMHKEWTSVINVSFPTLPPLLLLFHGSVWRYAHPCVGCHSDRTRRGVAHWIHCTNHCQNNTFCSGETKSNLSGSYAWLIVEQLATCYVCFLWILLGSFACVALQHFIAVGN